MYRLLLAALLLPACALERAADEGPHCEDHPVDVALSDATDLGFTAADVVAGIPTAETSVFTYVDGSTTDLSLGFTAAGNARFVTSEEVYPEGGITTDIAVLCDDRVEVDGQLSFSTADGAFAEVFDVVVSATAEAVGLSEELSLDALAGTFDITQFVLSEDYDALSAFLDVRFAGGASEGSISGQASGQDACAEADECTAWAENVEVGRWPTVE